MPTNFISARLVRGYRWYIIFYQEDPHTGKLERFRPTFDLNRIPSLRERLRKAKSHILVTSAGRIIMNDRGRLALLQDGDVAGVVFAVMRIF